MALQKEKKNNKKETLRQLLGDVFVAAEAWVGASSDDNDDEIGP